MYLLEHWRTRYWKTLASAVKLKFWNRTCHASFPIPDLHTEWWGCYKCRYVQLEDHLIIPVPHFMVPLKPSTCSWVQMEKVVGLLNQRRECTVTVQVHCYHQTGGATQLFTAAIYTCFQSFFPKCNRHSKQRFHYRERERVYHKVMPRQFWQLQDVILESASGKMYTEGRGRNELGCISLVTHIDFLYTSWKQSSFVWEVQVFYPDSYCTL